MRTKHWLAVAVTLSTLASPALGAIAITQAPQLNVTPHQVTIWWRTDVSGTTAVHFGPSPQATWSAYPNSSVFGAQAGTLHSRTLSHLAPGTWYYRVRSVDGVGDWAQSAEGTFVVPAPDQHTPLGQLSADGAVTAVLQEGNTLVLGGQFTRIGPRLGGGLHADASSGAVSSGHPMVAGVVSAAVSDGAGGLFIGGDFTHVGGLPRDRVAHLLPDGGVDPTWSATVNGPVLALLLSGSTLYLGGSFTAVGASTRSSLAALDASNGALLGWNPGANGAVNALSAAGGAIYLGGAFTTAGGVSRTRLAAVDAGTGALLPWAPGANQIVYALAVVGSTVYVGGAFSTLGGGPRANAGAVDLAGTLLPWSPNPDSQVRAFTFTSSTLYAAGHFQNVAGSVRGRAAAFDLATGALLPWDPNLTGLAYAIAQAGSTVYLGGFWTTAGGAPRLNAAAVHATTGVLQPWNPEPGPLVDVLVPVGSTIFVGGNLSTAGGAVRNGLAAIDVTSWTLLPWAPSVTGNVTSLANAGSTLFVGGTFTTLAGAARANLGAVDLATGTALAWNPAPNGTVLAVAATPTTVYAGGSFNSVGGAFRAGIAALDATTGAALASFNPGADSSVSTLALSGATLYVAGNFSTLGGATRFRVGAVDADTGALRPWIPNQNGSVSSLSVSGNAVYFGGLFDLVGTTLRNRHAAVDATTAALLPWNAQPSGISAVWVGAGGSTIVIGGGFTSVGGITPRSRIAALNPAGQIQPFNPGANAGPSVFAFGATGAGVRAHVGGAFTAIGGVPQGGFASFVLPAGPPEVLTNAAAPVAATSATLNGAAAPNGVSTTAHFRYTAGPQGACNDTFGTRMPASGGFALGPGPAFAPFAQGLTGLTQGTTYSYCAIASSTQGTGLGAIRTFTTPSPPTVTTGAATGVTGSTATLNGTGNANGDATTAYFRYGTTNPGTCDDTFGTRAPATGGAALSGMTSAPFNQALTGLAPLTTYFYCALATNSLGTTFGAVASFTTPDAPTVTTDPATGVTGVAATLHGAATPNGASTGGWFRYAATAPAACNDTFGTRTPTTGSVALGAGATPQAFSQALAGLTPGTTYTYCAIAANAAGTRFGQLLTFTTASPPTVTTEAATAVLGTTATVNASASPNGDATTGYFRFTSAVFSVCSDSTGTRVPAVGGTAPGSETSAQPFSEGLTGLTPGTRYYFCAAATSTAGTRFGAVLNFITPGAPAVATAAASQVTGSTATLNGNVNPSRDETTAYFRYATTTPGTCNDTFGTRVPASGGTAVGSGSTVVSFTEDLTGLAPGTTYFFCAIANNAFGTRFGAVLNFTTAAAPTVTTNAATAITGTTATLSGSANPNRDATTGYFRYAEVDPGACDDTFGTRTPATGGTALGSGTTAQAFTRPLTGLTEGTTYYFCAIASNAEGTRFGAVRTFTTLNTPQVTTEPATDFTGVSATLHGSANPLGLTTTGYFRYATTSPGTCNATFGTRAPSTGGSALGNGTTAQAFSQGVVGLTPGVTYYFCAIASSSAGTSYGEVLSFALGGPTVTTRPATAVTETTATLNAAATPNGSAAVGHFRYATTNPGTCNDGFGTRAPATGGTALGSGFANPAYAESVTGLAPGTTYFFCAIASNAVGFGVGAVLSFTTPIAAAAPTTTTLPASLLTTTTATLNGTAVPRGAPTAGHFRYATTNPGPCDDTFGTRAPTSGGTALGSGSVAQPWAEVLTGLTPGTTYYFCAIATNSEGQGLGATLAFTTPTTDPLPDAVAVTPVSATADVGARLAGALQVVDVEGAGVPGSRVVTVALTGAATICGSTLLNAGPLGGGTLSGETSPSGSATFEVCNDTAESVSVSATFAGQPGTSAPASWTWTAACPAPPSLAITEDANASAEVGRAYAYNSSGSVGVLGATGAVQYASCGTAPAGFVVNGTTGAVQWTPTSAGAFDLCVQAEDRCSLRTYAFTVTVTEPAAAGGCGCGSSGAGIPAWLVAAAALGVLRRRRRAAPLR